MLTRDARVFLSILRGLPVLARQLDSVALGRALRGRPLPSPGAYISFSHDMLDAVEEGGPFESKTGTR
jgi:hypothetical protein